MTVIMCFFHLFTIVDNHHRRARRWPGDVPVSVREPQPTAYEADFRFPVNVIVKIRRVCARRNKQNNGIPTPARFLESLFYPLADLASVRRIAEYRAAAIPAL